MAHDPNGPIFFGLKGYLVSERGPLARSDGHLRSLHGGVGHQLKVSYSARSMSSYKQD